LIANNVPHNFQGLRILENISGVIYLKLTLIQLKSPNLQILKEKRAYTDIY